mmetsp:Transcript_22221/g.37120  ORF Transcript_22221/g.37120 Transcript_22221/m.37120 type:complete len:247 (-) Transcript_22221:442-1182(-)
MRCNVIGVVLCGVLMLNLCSVNSDPGVYVKAASAAMQRTSKVIDLTEENFDAEIERGTYFVEVYADWCSRCRQIASTWEDLSQELDGEVFVGKINGPKEKALLSRLGVQGYPSFFLFKAGKTYEYASARGLQDLAQFAREGYLKTDPMPFYKAPNSMVGRIFGQITSFPFVFEKLYVGLHEEQGYSNLALIAIMLAVPVVTGIILICCIDIVSTRQRPAAQSYAHVNHNNGRGGFANAAPVRPHAE